MCFYSYDVYGRCGHCEIGLVSFCEDAVPIGDDTATQEQKEPATSRGDDDDDDDDNNDPDQPGPPRHASQASHSTQHQPSTGQDTAKSSPSGSSNTSFHTATSTPQHSTEHEQPSGQMDAVRQWMTSGSSTATTSQGSPANTSQQSKGEVAAAVSASQRQEPTRNQEGIREHSEESYNLPDGTQALEYLARSALLDPQNVGHDNARSAFVGSTDISNLDGNFERSLDTGNTDAMIAMINKMKAENAALRAQADRGRTKPKTEQELKMDEYLNTPLAKMSDLSKESGQTAQATLDKQQELFEEASSQAPKKKKKKSKSKSKRKKTAGQAVDDRHDSMASGADDEDSEVSQVNAATDESVVVSEDTAQTSPTRRSFEGGSREGTNSPSPPQTPLPKRTDDPEITPTQATFKGKGKGKAASGDALLKQPYNAPKALPSFAQPTQAYSIRAGETVRQEHTTTPASSPKTTRGSPQKRKSIPGNWLQGPFVQQEKEVEPKSAPVQSLGAIEHTSGIPAAKLASTHSPGAKVEGAGGPHAHLVADRIQAQVDAGEAPSAGSLRKKPSGYMSPTAAATRRNVATLGQESVKQVSPRVKMGALNIDTSQVGKQGRPSPLSAGSPLTAFPSYTEPKRAGSISPHKSKTHGLDMRFSAPSSPTKIPRPADGQGGRLKAHRTATSSHKRNESTLAALPEIANTTARRRTSQSHLLTPILKKLDSLSLLVDKHGHQQKPTEATCAPTPAVEQARLKPHERIAAAAAEQARLNPHERNQLAVSPSGSNDPKLSSRSLHSKHKGGKTTAASREILTRTPKVFSTRTNLPITDETQETKRSNDKRKTEELSPSRAASGPSTVTDKKENLSPGALGSRQSSVAIQSALQGPSRGINNAPVPQPRASSVDRPSVALYDPAVIATGPIVHMTTPSFATTASSRSSLRGNAPGFTPANFTPAQTTPAQTVKPWTEGQIHEEMEKLHNEGCSFHKGADDQSKSRKWPANVRQAVRTISTYRNKQPQVENRNAAGALGNVGHLMKTDLWPRIKALDIQVNLANDRNNQRQVPENHHAVNKPQMPAVQALAESSGFSSAMPGVGHVSVEDGSSLSGNTNETQYPAGSSIDLQQEHTTRDEYSPLPTDDFLTAFHKVRARPIPAEYSGQDPSAPTYNSTMPFSDNADHLPSSWRMPEDNSSGSDSASTTPTNSVNPAVSRESSPNKGWTVDSAHPTRQYGWSGGDGREISFSGYGPLAESNPNSPVNFSTAEGTKVFPTNHLTPKAPATAPTAPKKMVMSEEAKRKDFKRLRDAAIRSGYPMVPCGNMTFVRAHEHVGYGYRPGLGYCNECTSKRPELLDMLDMSGTRPPPVEMGRYIY
ncbi:hypothetical protein MBLNU230_g3479t1 [Neophaeotheca triangularis]